MNDTRTYSNVLERTRIAEIIGRLIPSRRWPDDSLNGKSNFRSTNENISLPMFLCYPEGSIGTWYESVFLSFFSFFLFGKKEARKNETRRIEETNYRVRVYLEDSVFNFQDFLNIYYNAFLSFLLHRFFFPPKFKTFAITGN